MLLLPPVIEWANALTLTLPVKFFEGPEDPEFGHHNLVGTFTLAPGGQGETKQGMFEEDQLILSVKGRREQRSKLVQSARELDIMLRNIANATIWGTYVRYVLRQGSVGTSFEDPERDRIIATYLIETGN